MNPLLIAFLALVGLVFWALAAGGLYLVNLMPAFTGIHEWLFSITFLYWYCGIWGVISIAAMIIDAVDRKNHPGPSSLPYDYDNDPSIGNPSGFWGD